MQYVGEGLLLQIRDMSLSLSLCMYVCMYVCIIYIYVMCVGAFVNVVCSLSHTCTRAVLEGLSTQLTQFSEKQVACMRHKKHTSGHDPVS